MAAIVLCGFTTRHARHELISTHVELGEGRDTLTADTTAGVLGIDERCIVGGDPNSETGFQAPTRPTLTVGQGNDALELLRAMRIPILRFPGGTDADYIDWTDMISNAPGRDAEQGTSQEAVPGPGEAPVRDRRHGRRRDPGARRVPGAVAARDPWRDRGREAHPAARARGAVAAVDRAEVRSAGPLRFTMTRVDAVQR